MHLGLLRPQTMPKRSDKPFGSRYLCRDLDNSAEGTYTFEGSVPESFSLLVWPAALARALMDDYIRHMCGRVIQSSGPLRYAIVDGMNIRDSRVHNYPPPSMTCSEIPYALQGPYELVQTGARSMDLHR